jgi:hypothetical protein
VGIWLDINDDKDFDDPGEYLGNGTTSGCVKIISVTIPVGTPNGSKRLRVRAIGYFETMASTASCGYFSIGEAEDYTLVVSAAAALAIQLLDFKATKHTSKSTLIAWKTASEKDVDKLILQVSNDTKNYITLTEMAANGRQTEGAAYQFEHITPFKGMNYYRLMERTRGGKITQVAQNTLLFQDNSSFIIQPNPTQGSFTLNLYADAPEKVDISIYDVLGRIVLDKQLDTQIGENKLAMELPATLPNGVYVVRVEQNGILKTAKIKKQD